MSSRTVDRDTMPALIGESEAGAAPQGGGDDLDKAPGWIYVLLAGGLFLVVAPFMWMLLSSFKPEREVRAVPPNVTCRNVRPSACGRVLRGT